jgi:hypothetical protein
MKTPQQLAEMKLGCRVNQAFFKPVTMYAADATLPAAYSRDMQSPLVEGNNSEIGDCVETAGCNAAQDFIGSSRTIPNIAAQTAYSAITGYSPTQPGSDNGTDPEVFFAWWKNNSISGVQLKTATPIDPSNLTALKHSIATARGVFLCVALSVEMQNMRQWTPLGAPGSWGSHAVWADSYDGGVFFVTSWGERISILSEFFTTPGFAIAAWSLELSLP